jgi:hypothetical protein
MTTDGIGALAAVYELALLTQEHAREKHVDLAVTIITAERRPLAVFGESVSAMWRSGSFGGEFSSWEIDGDAGAAEVDEGDEGVG